MLVLFNVGLLPLLHSPEIRKFELMWKVEHPVKVIECYNFKENVLYTALINILLCCWKIGDFFSNDWYACYISLYRVRQITNENDQLADVIVRHRTKAVIGGPSAKATAPQLYSTCIQSYQWCTLSVVGC